jgi:1,4-dihydroxy-2-naphthoate polyprenyltransferase
MGSHVFDSQPEIEVVPMLAQRLRTWRTVYNTANLPEGMTVPPDAVSKWLVITRAAVFSMTVTSGLIGGLLAIGSARLAGDVAVDWGLLALAIVGLVVAHAANNMINDFFDLEGGVDTDDYVRALYAPHPILSGWVTKRQLGAAILIANGIDLAILLFLVAQRGPLVAAFALGGLFVSVFYVAPPIRLKHIGLGEPGVFLVWGPLMVVGTFFVATGEIPAWTWVASLPYAILVTTVLFGKHIDKIEADRKKGVRTMPVLLGERRARVGRPGPDGGLLPDRRRRGAGRLDRAVGAHRRPRPAEARSDAQVLLEAPAGDAAPQLRRLAALVRRRVVRPHAPGGCAADPRSAPQRPAPAPLAVLAVGARESARRRQPGLRRHPQARPPDAGLSRS